MPRLWVQVVASHDPIAMSDVWSQGYSEQHGMTADISATSFAAQAQRIIHDIQQCPDVSAVEVIAAALGAVCDAAHAESAEKYNACVASMVALRKAVQDAMIPHWQQHAEPCHVDCPACALTRALASNDAGAQFLAEHRQRAEEVRQLREALINRIGTMCGAACGSRQHMCPAHRLLAATELSHG